MQIVQLIVNSLILRGLDCVESVVNPGQAGGSVRWVYWPKRANQCGWQRVIGGIVINSLGYVVGFRNRHRARRLQDR
jgi:hypothetical protein